MSDAFDHIVRCLDLGERDVAEAIVDRDATKDLLARLSAVSAPNTGAAKALLVYARMATTACEWIEGDLRIELTAAGDATLVEAATELGGGLRERLLPLARFGAPIAEFARAIERVPHMVAPLVVRGRSAHRLSLAATEGVRRTTAPPPAVTIASESLYTPPVAVAPAKPPDSGPPQASAGDDTADTDKGWDE